MFRIFAVVYLLLYTGCALKPSVPEWAQAGLPVAEQVPVTEAVEQLVKKGDNPAAFELTFPTGELMLGSLIAFEQNPASVLLNENTKDFSVDTTTLALLTENGVLLNLPECRALIAENADSLALEGDALAVHFGRRVSVFSLANCARINQFSVGDGAFTLGREYSVLTSGTGFRIYANASGSELLSGSLLADIVAAQVYDDRMLVLDAKGNAAELNLKTRAFSPTAKVGVRFTDVRARNGVLYGITNKKTFAHISFMRQNGQFAPFVAEIPLETSQCVLGKSAPTALCGDTLVSLTGKRELLMQADQVELLEGVVYARSGDLLTAYTDKPVYYKSIATGFTLPDTCVMNDSIVFVDLDGAVRTATAQGVRDGGVFSRDCPEKAEYRSGMFLNYRRTVSYQFAVPVQRKDGYSMMKRGIGGNLYYYFDKEVSAE